MKAAEVMVVFDIQSKRTAHPIAKRGYYIVDYKNPGHVRGLWRRKGALPDS